MVLEGQRIMIYTKSNMIENQNMVKNLNIKVVNEQNVINRSCQEWSKKFEISWLDHDSDLVQHGWEKGHGQELDHDQRAKCYWSKLSRKVLKVQRVMIQTKSDMIENWNMIKALTSK